MAKAAARKIARIGERCAAGVRAQTESNVPLPQRARTPGNFSATFLLSAGPANSLLFKDQTEIDPISPLFSKIKFPTRKIVTF
ncbi:MAG: hypothetical protein WBQ72_00420 [Terriglobales bacterium]